MRTIHADLTTAQASDSRTPFLTITLTNRVASLTDTYATTDSTNRILYCQTADARYGGQLDVPGSKFPIAGIIRLQNSDGALDSKEFRGRRVDIGYGFNTASGNKSDQSGPLFVLNVRRFSFEGFVYLELQLGSLWEMARIRWINNTAIAPVAWIKGESTATSIRHIMMELFGGDPLGAVVTYNGSTYTSETVDAADTGADDVALFDGTPAVGDIVYFGLATRFNRISNDLTTVGSGSWSQIWEYWDGDSWEALSIGTVGGATANNFRSGELQIISFDLPSDIATQNLNGTDSAFPNESLYYVRVRITIFGSQSTLPISSRIFAGMDFGIALDTSTAGQNDDVVPAYETQPRENIAVTAENILKFTRLGLFVRQDGFHLAFVDNSQGSPDYTYDTGHVFHIAVLDESYIIPNKVIVVSEEPQAGVTYGITGSAENTTSSSQHGVISTVVVDPTITSSAEGDAVADDFIYNLLRDANQGDVEVPMQVNQEVWDQSRVVDARSGKNFNGRVSQLIRLYDPQRGLYRLRIVMGSVTKQVVARLLFDEPDDVMEMRSNSLESLEQTVEGSYSSTNRITSAQVVDKLVVNTIISAGGIDIELTADANLAVNEVVYASGDLSVNKSTSVANEPKHLGVIQETKLSGEKVRVRILGIVSVVPDTTIAIGDRLKASTSTAGRVTPTNTHVHTIATSTVNHTHSSAGHVHTITHTHAGPSHLHTIASHFHTHLGTHTHPVGSAHQHVETGSTTEFAQAGEVGSVAPGSTNSGGDGNTGSSGTANTGASSASNSGSTTPGATGNQSVGHNHGSGNTGTTPTGKVIAKALQASTVGVAFKAVLIHTG